MIEIKKLTDKNSPDIDTICDWSYRWWGEPNGYTKEKMRNQIDNSLKEDRIPQTFGAYIGDKIVGMYQLSMSDCDVRPDVYPWLVNVYVDEKYRGQGVFCEMMRSLAENVKTLKLSELYLYTQHIGLYEKFGWDFVELFHSFAKDGDIQRLYRLDIKYDKK